MSGYLLYSLILFTFLCQLDILDSFRINSCRSRSRRTYQTLDALPTFPAADLLDAIHDATIMTDFDSAIALITGEALSGAIGALASRGTANAIGDLKVDSVLTKVSSTSLFFGARAFLRSIETVAGVPRPLALLSSSIIASFLSEFTKSVGRNNDIYKNAEECNKTDNSIIKGLELPEICGDLTKWLLYDYLQDLGLQTKIVALYVEMENAQYLTYSSEKLFVVANGALAATIGVLVKNSLTAKDGKKSKVLEAAIEGAVLFFIYKTTIDVLSVYNPFNFELVFQRILDYITYTTGVF